MKIGNYINKCKWDIVWGTLIKVVESAGDIVIPFLMANIIDIGIPNKDMAYIVGWSIGILMITIIGFGSSVLCQYLAAKAGQKVGFNIRHDLYSHINTFSHKELDKFGTSTLINRFSNDISRINNGIEVFIRQTARAPILLIGSSIMMFYIAPKLALIFLMIVPVISIVVAFIMIKSNKLFDKVQKDLDTVSLHSKENLEGAKVVRAFNKEDHEKVRFDKSADKLYKSQKKVANITALMNPITNSIVNIGIILILWVGGIQVNIGGLTQGKVIATISYLTQIGTALIMIARMITVFIRAFASSRRIQEIFNTKSSINQKTKDFLPIHIEEGTPKVEFRNVSFRYGSELKSKNAIENFNLKVMKGQTIGIIGGTGSGKTTIINLIPRYYDATEGDVLIDGKNVKEYSFEQLRSQIGVVPQKAVLFKGTIDANMRWRNPNATAGEIQKALLLSQSMEFVEEFPDKTGHKLNAGGSNVSGGQRQRLTIARALVGDPEILILDDSASALDFATDAKLRKAIKYGIKNSTIFIVTQRVTSIKDADVIVCIDKGQVVGMGKHSELLENCEVYKEIYESQTK